MYCCRKCELPVGGDASAIYENADIGFRDAVHGLRAAKEADINKLRGECDVSATFCSHERKNAPMLPLFSDGFRYDADVNGDLGRLHLPYPGFTFEKNLQALGE